MPIVYEKSMSNWCTGFARVDAFWNLTDLSGRKEKNVCQGMHKGIEKDKVFAHFI